MPKETELQKEIKEAVFLKALVESGGVAKDAYKATRPNVTDGSAGVLGSNQLAKLKTEDVNAICESIGCTKRAVLTGLWERMRKTRRDSDYIKGTSVLSKIAGWETSGNGLKEIFDRDLDLVEIVKIRLSKSKDNKDLQKPIDIPSKSSDDVDKKAEGKATATENDKVSE